LYRTAPRSTLDVLEEHLAPHGFVRVGSDYLHRKTWNTNRGVALSRVEADFDLRRQVGQMRKRAAAPLGHSWWAQLGLQLVLEQNGPPTSEDVLQRFVDGYNHQGVLVQSIFVLDATTGQWRQARTWGQFITAKYQDAIAAALEEIRKHRERSGSPSS
jgi:hypothetical protein